jgi:hypothetical protein
MAGEARRFWPPPSRLRFRIEMVDDQHLTVDAVGMGMDGPDLIFFGRWPEEGGIPIANRVPRERVVSVTKTPLHMTPVSPTETPNACRSRPDRCLAKA